MHEFLIQLKQWQNQPKFKENFSKINGKEQDCLKSANSEDEMQKCKELKLQIERHMYKKESQFIQMIYQKCYQGEDNTKISSCYQEYQPNLQLVISDLNVYLDEKVKDQI